jgi:hypothetical protein
MKRFINKKVVATAAVVGLALGGAGIASAYILGNGSATGGASVGSGTASGFTVSSPGLQGGPLSIDPPNVDTIWSSLSNFTGLPATLHQIQVEITGVTVDQNTQNPAWPDCTADQFVLSASSTSPWQGLTPGPGGVSTGPSATWSQNLPLTVPNGDYVTSTQGLSSSVVNGVPDGLTLEWVDQGPSVIQNNCLGATVNVTVSAN